MKKRDLSQPLRWENLHKEEARFEVYAGNVARVRFSPLSETDGPVGGIRGVIRDQSSQSRRRAAFAFGTATCSWAYFSTLTVHYCCPANTWKECVADFKRRWLKKWNEPPCAWIQEIQKRGAPHLHLFHAAESAFGMACAREKTWLREKDGAAMVGGEVEEWLIWAWLHSTGQTLDKDAVNFNELGILEVFRAGKHAAGNYIAKESGKAVQKKLPPWMADGIGRWWWLNPKWKNKSPMLYGQLDLKEWPWDTPFSYVWDWRNIVDCVTHVVATEHAAPELAAALPALPAPAPVKSDEEKEIEKARRKVRRRDRSIDDATRNRRDERIFAALADYLALQNEWNEDEQRVVSVPVLEPEDVAYFQPDFFR